MLRMETTDLTCVLYKNIIEVQAPWTVTSVT